MSVIHWSDTELGAIVAYGLEPWLGSEMENARLELADDAAQFSEANTRAFRASYRDEAGAMPWHRDAIALASREWANRDRASLAKKARHVACLLNYNQIDQAGRDHATLEEALAMARLQAVVLTSTVEDIDQS